MHDYGFFSYASKAEMLEKSARYWNPDKTAFWQQLGVDLVIDRREDYFLYDMSGHRLIDMHLNGGTYNFGHRNAELVAALKGALDHFDMGNHHFPALARTALAEALAKTAPWDECFTVYASGGGEAIDIALKTARHATQRRTIVSIVKAYHGHTGLAVCTGDGRFSELFLADRPDEFVQVPFNDLAAMERVLARGDVAAVIMETIPATYGFPMPAPGYLPAVKTLCERFGALYIADEVQTGLMRTGTMWAIEGYGVVPDIIVSAKGLGGGLYPLGAVLLSERAAGWLREDGFGHISTGGGAELGCIVALKVLEMCARPEVAANVAAVSAYFAGALGDLMRRHAGFFSGVRQNGLIIGLEFDHPQGAKFVSRALYEHGVWAIFSTLDPRVLQFKPGVLMSRSLCEDVVARLDAALAVARGYRDAAARAA
ncbi:class-III pyridoxal-phosphate-dependent aminotransferase [Methylobrevis albus]|uniref:Aspartate aminotransferase family protein n=1 Tax=Methylobrevis albus TaxID=2793297 RepID=A0A931I1X0_9HYPH|nr:aminotransferase class III-fold pyridoxal phosphate-dependent enzyme [Methylobrevis albus]MBH0237751.1 aspartate aminotransferase family protein [Methylobrevis albus]